MKNKDDYELCYVDGRDGYYKAYFTNNFKEQWGDDWDDKPYEHNAEEPYTHYFKDNIEYPIDIIGVYFEPRGYNYPLLPCDGYTNSPYSVEDINKGAIAWIHTDSYNIQARTKLKDFKQIIKENGGKIYVLEN